jgi:hypothetical protein
MFRYFFSVGRVSRLQCSDLYLARVAGQFGSIRTISRLASNASIRQQQAAATTQVLVDYPVQGYSTEYRP